MSEEISDEPSRVASITSGLFGSQSGNPLAHLPNGTSVVLEGGADRRDDAAWFTADGPVTIVAASDYVRGPKFMLYELGLLSNYDLGYYLVGANLSDIAAMGAEPIALMSVVRYPNTLPDADFHDIMRGIHDACAAGSVMNVGGDIGSAERIILSASALGATTPGAALTRAGAKPGDALWLSGETGIALAAMTYFSKRQANHWQLSHHSETVLLNAWKRVRPEIALGLYLSRQLGATSCQDTSDGLKATIEQLAASSGVQFDIDLNEVPVHPVVREVSELAGLETNSLVFGGSVDFRLLFTVRPGRDTEKELRTRFPNCRMIGTAREPELGGIAKASELPGAAWVHQADPLSGSA